MTSNNLCFSRTAKKGTCVIDCSTIDVRTSKEMAEESRKKNFRFVDAPVSGGITLFDVDWRASGYLLIHRCNWCSERNFDIHGWWTA